MNQDLDNQLCTKYPKIFRDRHAPMNQTCMCWGFSHDNGWYNIIDQLCANIQRHIDRSRKERAKALLFNRGLGRALQGDRSSLERLYTFGDTEQSHTWAAQHVDKLLSEPEPQCKIVPTACAQVVAVQVKEKFGTLRFYHNGGDDVIQACVDMAESMSSVTCEVCGSPGVSRSGGWIRTLCDDHAEGREEMNWKDMP